MSGVTKLAGRVLVRSLVFVSFGIEISRLARLAALELGVQVLSGTVAVRFGGPIKESV